MTIIPLSCAYLCLDCEAVGDKAAYCPVCKSSAVYSLQKFLDRVQPTLVDAVFERILKGSVR